MEQQSSGIRSISESILLQCGLSLCGFSPAASLGTGLSSMGPPPSHLHLVPQRPRGQSILLQGAGAGQRHSYYSEDIEPEGGRIKIRASSYSLSLVTRPLFLKTLSLQGSPWHEQDFSCVKVFPISLLGEFRVGDTNKFISHGSKNL